MNQQNSESEIKGSFVTLMAMLMALIALSIDFMMPALGQIGQDLQVQNPNDTQLIISIIFVGLGFGTLFFGPFSDSFGRKRAIYLGMVIFLGGCLASIFAASFKIMLIGRLLQGLGAASCRVATICMIRDKYEGNAMARVMSFIMIIFILSPALAPSLGQGVLLFAGWRAIFVVIFMFGAVALLWLGLGQEETLRPENRLPFRLKPISIALKETAANKTARGYTIASGIIFGAFTGYLNSAQQIFQVQYELGRAFALVFGLLALSLGLASFANTRWVYRYGMQNICRRALVALVGVSTLFLPISLFLGGHPPLFLLIGYLALTFFCCGLLFGNFNAMAIQPLGHIAGAASSVIGSMQSLISAGLGTFVGAQYNGTINPLVIGFFVLGTCSMILVSRLGSAQ